MVMCRNYIIMAEVFLELVSNSISPTATGLEPTTT